VGTKYNIRLEESDEIVAGSMEGWPKVMKGRQEVIEGLQKVKWKGGRN
jgi:hypothetical protein